MCDRESTCNLNGSFLAVSKPILRVKISVDTNYMYSLKSAIRDLQDLHTFAPLRPQHLRPHFLLSLYNDFWDTFCRFHAPFNLYDILLDFKKNWIFAGFLKMQVHFAVYIFDLSYGLKAGGRLRGGRAAAPPNPTAERPGPRWFGCAGSPAPAVWRGPTRALQT